MGNKVFVITFGILILCCTTNAVSQHLSTADSVLSKIERLYERGDYATVELEARRALESLELKDSSRIELEQYLAFALVAQGNTKSAVDHFVQIFMMNENFSLDPILTSPKILTVFEEAKQSFEEMKRQKQKATITTMNVQGRKSVSLRVILFPGLEQLHQGRKTEGYVFMCAGIVTASMTGYFSIERSKYRKKYLDADTPAKAQDFYKDYNNFHKARAYSAYAFLATYLCSEISAIVFNSPQHSMTFRTNLQNQQFAVMMTMPF